MIIQRFKVRDILEDHMFGPEDDTSRRPIDAADVSGLLTFFFGIFYLQYVINRRILGHVPGEAMPPHALAGAARA